MERTISFHQANILVHVVSGSVALLLGVMILLTAKGSTLHTKIGRVFLYFMGLVILTALIGVFVFSRNTFLLVITILSGYYGFSGYRVLKTKSNEARWPDVLVAVVAVVVVGYYLYYLRSIGMFWKPVVIYSTVATLVLLVGYDLSRYLIPRHKYRNLWLYEHIYKMIGAFTALLSAFSGTVFEEYQPWSQLLPSVLGIGLQIGFIGYFAKRPLFSTIGQRHE